MSGILFVDLDGTVRLGKDEIGRFVNGPEDVAVYEEVPNLLREWRVNYGPVIGITNQGGVGLGFMTRQQNSDALQETWKCAAKQIDAFAVCEHRPDANCFCRKPMTGLIYQGICNLNDKLSTFTREESLMIGDMESDRECAERAGIDFMWAQDWRQNGTIR